MEYRILGRTGRSVSAIGLGTWQIGGNWGTVSEKDAFAVLDAAAEAGVTFLDTADVYGDGRSEQLIGRWRAQNPDWRGTVATKMIRRATAPSLQYATEANFRAWAERSRQNLGAETLDLVQLHCPETAVLEGDQVYDALDALVEEGVMAAYGVSVETCDQALTAIARPHVASVQIILNAFRQKPLEKVLPAAAQAGVGIIVRVPLASGLLSGRYTEDTVFAADDHRSFNRNGEAFDVGETFAGVEFSTGVAAAAEFSHLAGAAGLAPAQAALAWAAQQPGVTTVIPGARSAEQAASNAAAGNIPPLSPDFLDAVARLYETKLKPQIHHRW
ncbi:aldo/keto reductase [Nesterenkonia alkaliphila]|uniref:Aldo/keto reductase n=1 Tax=Nesterenkonia alkaliphila TaxID=1463631 RepID=A0A7K1UIX8_9MICC|nr:aldo/keto reductase [Nesterenkonia alkaliphila]MVT26366.1 aldo/keto reductase [Nesterenkonia alkaliphila]GFZ88629.1 aldo/keto reductase [Nesterenkonia alkaliphila]